MATSNESNVWQLLPFVVQLVGSVRKHLLSKSYRLLVFRGRTRAHRRGNAMLEKAKILGRLYAKSEISMAARGNDMTLMQTVKTKNFFNIEETNQIRNMCD